MKMQHRNPQYCMPPGSFEEFLKHPNPNRNVAIEKVIFKEHRFAFFYWLKWNEELRRKRRITGPPPALVTIDWHRDLCRPSENEKEELTKLNQNDLSEVALFAWARLNGNNDGHILSAAYLNLIGDIIVLCKQSQEKEFEFSDRFENVHKVNVFTDFERFTGNLRDSNFRYVYFDLDLDYFVKKQGLLYETKGWKLVSKKDIKSIINPENQLFTWLFSAIEGFTIATEPEHCGGILKSIHILKIVEEQLFTKEKAWKHLTN